MRVLARLYDDNMCIMEVSNVLTIPMDTEKGKTEIVLCNGNGIHHYAMVDNHVAIELINDLNVHGFSDICLNYFIEDEICGGCADEE